MQVRAALSVHGKKFDETQMDMVVKKPETGNPLFLRTVLDEARFFGNFFMLTQYVWHTMHALVGFWGVGTGGGKGVAS